jgi:GxxExxY protein
MSELIYRDESCRIIGACLEVYKEKGCGFLEAVYQECLEKELVLQGIPLIAQIPIALAYKGQPLKQRYQADIVCHEKILIELKAVSVLADEHRASSESPLRHWLSPWPARQLRPSPEAGMGAHRGLMPAKAAHEAHQIHEMEPFRSHNEIPVTAFTAAAKSAFVSSLVSVFRGHPFL